MYEAKRRTVRVLVFVQILQPPGHASENEHGDVIIQCNPQAPEAIGNLTQVPAVDILHDSIIHRVLMQPSATPAPEVALDAQRFRLQPIDGHQIRVIEQDAELNFVKELRETI